MEITYIQNNSMCSLSCDNDHVLHDTRKPEVAEIRRTTIMAYDADYWEELPSSAVPPYTEEEYKRKVAELIHQRYDHDDETALINNFVAEPSEKHHAEYAEYQAYREQCKQQAKDPELYNTESEAGPGENSDDSL